MSYISNLEEQNEELKQLLADAQEKLAMTNTIVSGLVVHTINRSFDNGYMRTEIVLYGTTETSFDDDIKNLLGNIVSISTRKHQ